jgi:hypothetical protein
MASRELDKFWNFGARFQVGAKLDSLQLPISHRLANSAQQTFGTPPVQKSVYAILSPPLPVVEVNSVAPNFHAHAATDQPNCRYPQP